MQIDDLIELFETKRYELGIDEALDSDDYASYPPALKALTTEKAHSATSGLSTLAQGDAQGITAALEMLIEADKRMLKRIVQHQNTNQHQKLVALIKSALENKRKIFLLGCGASGRAALQLEKILNISNLHAIMGGGDTALVAAIEKFEDHREYGIRQLHQAGWQPGDLVIGLSASGTAPFVNGILEHVANNSGSRGTPCAILFLNNDCDEVKTNSPSHPLHKEELPIEYYSLNVGPNAITGSSRMQSASVAGIELGDALTKATDREPSSSANKLIEALERNKNAIKQLHELTNLEAIAYQANEAVTYIADEDIGLTVFTDVTERAPTFGVPPIDNLNTPPSDSSRYAKAFVTVRAKDKNDMRNTWEIMLGRTPRFLNWLEAPSTSTEHSLGYDFKVGSEKKRGCYSQNKEQHYLEIKKDKTYFHFYYDNKEISKIDIRGLNLMQATTLLKMVLNAHSTTLMAKLGYVAGNKMTHVQPSNVKLIARIVRYIWELITVPNTKDLTRDQCETIKRKLGNKLTHIYEIFKQEVAVIKPGESIVLRCAERLKKELLEYQPPSLSNKAMAYFSPAAQQAKMNAAAQSSSQIVFGAQR